MRCAIVIELEKLRLYESLKRLSPQERTRHDHLLLGVLTDDPDLLKARRRLRKIRSKGNLVDLRI